MAQKLHILERSAFIVGINTGPLGRSRGGARAGGWGSHGTFSLARGRSSLLGMVSAALSSVKEGQRGRVIRPARGDGRELATYFHDEIECGKSTQREKRSSRERKKKWGKRKPVARSLDRSRRKKRTHAPCPKETLKTCPFEKLKRARGEARSWASSRARGRRANAARAALLP